MAAQERTRQDHVLVGIVAKAHGIKGEIRVRSLADQPGNLIGYSQVELVSSVGEVRSCQVVRARLQGAAAIMALAGIASRDEAEAVVACEVWVHQDQLAPVAPGEHYWHELEGLRVLTGDGRELGVVSGMLATPAHDILVITGSAGKELLVPACPPFLERVDIAAGILVVAPLPGLLEIND